MMPPAADGPQDQPQGPAGKPANYPDQLTEWEETRKPNVFKSFNTKGEEVFSPEPDRPGGPLDPHNIWGPGELDRWAVAIIDQERALVQQALKLNDTLGHPDTDQALFRTLRLLEHWLELSVRVEALREEMKKPLLK